MAVHQTNILLETGTNEVEILEFYIDEEGYRGSYGVNVAKVLEIIPLPTKIVRPPNTRAGFVAGIFNHRDKLVAMLDLALWLGKGRSDQGSPKVLITEFNNMVTGFLVSGVNRIHRVTWGDIKPLDGYMEELSDTITGVIKLEDRIVFITDLEKAISDLDPQMAMAGTPSLLEGNNDGETYEPIRILHVDDSAVIRRTVKKRLEENQLFAVMSFENGDQAWTQMVELKEKSRKAGTALTDYIEAVLSDIEMPGMDGYHFCKRIKDDADLKDIPVILFSSLINEKLFHKGEAVGADGQFTKPDLRLMNFIKDIVDKRRTVIL
jgi:two-component system, chemotaxis family, chemotaxis protein CheV